MVALREETFDFTVNSVHCKLTNVHFHKRTNLHERYMQHGTDTDTECRVAQRNRSAINLL